MTVSAQHGATAGIELTRVLAGSNHSPLVYFARVAGHIKIGTTTNLIARMRSFYVRPDDVLLVVPGGREVEQAYHARFNALRVAGSRRELFRFAGELAVFLTYVAPAPIAPVEAVSLMPRRPDAARNWVTIGQAKEAGWIPRTWKNPNGAFGTLKHRAKREGRPVPEVKGWDGTRALYDAPELAVFIEHETTKERSSWLQPSSS